MKITYIAVLACLLCWAESAFAQKRSVVKIDDFKIHDVKTPDYGGAADKGGKGSKSKWCRVEVKFATSEDWLDEVELRWLVLVSADNSKRPLGLFRNVTYEYVKQGNHYASVYIRPRFFERYMKSGKCDASKISVYVEAYVKGQRVASQDKRANGIPSGWQKLTDQMRKMENALLPKSLTPFAPVDCDYYEDEKITIED
ncbi:MAG: hypothetical protein IJJ33_11545 [Victivallales bacterium]|nr:hypothetical protein [Victivallales bacterium]